MTPRSTSKRWRAFVIAVGALAIVSLGGVVFVPASAGLVLLAIYCIPANSILPVPHEPGVLYMAAFYPPLLVAVAATVGSLVASVSDYAVVESALRNPRIDRVRERGVVGWAIRGFRRAPFAITFACSLVPLLPISIVRALAPASDYPFGRYLAAGGLGRLPRFYGLAYLGHTIAVPAWVLVVVTGVTVAVAWATSRSAAADGPE